MKTRFQTSSQRGQSSLWSGTQCRPLRELRPAIEVQLGARSARPDVGHPPPVLLVTGGKVAPAHESLGRQPDLVAPDVMRDVVGRIDRRREPLAGDPEVAREEVPGPVDRLALEVVAEAPVAEHLEQRVMTRRPSDLLEVVVLAGDPQDPLVVDGAGVRPLLGAGQRVLELDHARVREEQRLVAGGDEAGAGNHRVAALLEELDEAAADLGAGQRRDARVWAHARGRHGPQWYRTPVRPRDRPDRPDRYVSAMSDGRGSVATAARSGSR